MTPIRVAVLLAAGLTTLPTLVHAQVLPFWSRPFPYGYAGGESDCIVTRRVKTRYGSRIERIDRCAPILHARG